MPIDLDDRGQALENEYFHRREQELIANLKAKIQDDDAKRLGITCPKCDGVLIEADFAKIKIDVCDKCAGVWLDSGELAQIVEQSDETSWFGKLFG